MSSRGASGKQAGTQLRVAVKVVDTSTGTHLWANTYNRVFSPDDLFALQDDLVPPDVLVSTVADAYGILPHRVERVRWGTAFAHLTPDEALMRSLSYAERVTPEEHGEAKAALERALEQSPAHSDCWAMLWNAVLTDEYGAWVRRKPRDARPRAEGRATSRRDVEPLRIIAPTAAELTWALFLPKGVSGVPSGRGARVGAQFHGRLHGCLRGANARLLGRLGRRVLAHRASDRR